jgi:hypothetical protein
MDKAPEVEAQAVILEPVLEEICVRVLGIIDHMVLDVQQEAQAEEAAHFQLVYILEAAVEAAV